MKKSRACPVEFKAAELYFNHMGLDRGLQNYMWRQCSEDYRSAWRVIASAALEKEAQDRISAT